MLDAVGQVIVAGLAVATLARVDPTLTLAVLAPVVVVIILVRIANARIITFRQAAQQSIGNVTGLLGDVFSAALAIKVADAEERIVAHLRKLNESRRRAQLADRVFTAFVSAASTNVANLGTAVLLLLAAKSMSEGRFTVGDFALFVSYLGFVTEFTGLRVPDRDRTASVPRGQVRSTGTECHDRVITWRLEFHQHRIDVIDIARELRQSLVPRLHFGIILLEAIQRALELDQTPNAELVPVILGCRALEMIERRLVLALVVQNVREIDARFGVIAIELERYGSSPRRGGPRSERSENRRTPGRQLPGGARRHFR